MATNELPTERDGKLVHFAWPGGYPILYLDGCNETLCPNCAQRLLDELRDDIRETIRQEVNEGNLLSTAELRRIRFHARVGRGVPRAYFIHYEGPPEFCAECGREVESAYGDPDEEDD